MQLDRVRKTIVILCLALVAASGVLLMAAGLQGSGGRAGGDPTVSVPIGSPTLGGPSDAPTFGEPTSAATVAVPTATVPAAVTPAPTKRPTPTPTLAVRNLLHLGEMPIGAWVAPPPSGTTTHPASFIDDTSYKGIADCGLNFIIGLYERNGSEQIDTALDLAAAHGLRYVVHDTRLLGFFDDEVMIRKYVEPYMDHPAYGGHLISDEPGALMFPRIASVMDLFRKISPRLFPYLNLFPNYATPQQLKYRIPPQGATDGITYAEYLDGYLAATDPDFISYDYYPMTGAFPRVSPGYFDNLDAIRTRTRSAGIPFWVFIQCCSFGEGVRVPTKAEIEWQVSMALAYGSRGIQYFTYWTPTDGGSEAFSDALVTRDGEKTERWYFVQEMNRHLTSVDGVLMTADNVGVLVHGTMPAPVRGSSSIGAFPPVDSIEGSAALVGCFVRPGGGKALYVVNPSLTGIATVTVRFEGPLSVKVYEDASTRSVKVDPSGLILSLDPGEGQLVEIGP